MLRTAKLAKDARLDAEPNANPPTLTLVMERGTIVHLAASELDS